MALLSPQKSRTRASSTSLRTPSLCHTLGRRRSTSFLRAKNDDETPPPEPCTPPPPAEPASSPTMLAVFVSRFIQWLHIPEKHALSWSPPSTPRTSSDDSLLPLSASAHTLSFVVPDPPKPSSPLFRWQFKVHAPIVFVILLFPVSTALVLWCLSTLPISQSWPHDISDLAQIGRELHGYSQSGSGPILHVIGVMAISAIWKHAWSIPGSVLWNVLGGALFSPFYATILLTTLTTIGSICATLLSTPLGPFLANLFPRALDMTRNALGGDTDKDPDVSGPKRKSSPWVRLSVLRLIGVVPWSGINIACGVCGVSLVDCMLGTFIGCLPWTAVTCQIGDILQTVASSPTRTSATVSSLLTTPEIIFKLVFLSILSLAPILGRGRLRSMLSNSSRTSQNSEKDARWRWVQDWRSKLASRSRSSERQADLATLATLVDEKRRLEDISS